jgi:hypothetical protein
MGIISAQRTDNLSVGAGGLLKTVGVMRGNFDKGAVGIAVDYIPAVIDNDIFGIVSAY